MSVIRTSRGHCGVTPNEADCAAGSMGAWTETSTTGCIQRCLECARCHFVSFSAELQDCSWYIKCSHLEGTDGTHETVQVCPSTLPCPGPSPILDPCPSRARDRPGATLRVVPRVQMSLLVLRRIDGRRAYRRHRAAGESPAEGIAHYCGTRDVSVREPHAACSGVPYTTMAVFISWRNSSSLSSGLYFSLSHERPRAETLWVWCLTESSVVIRRSRATQFDHSALTPLAAITARPY